jgi:ATPase subunit of ABC transporter with duplicated ATPase domains
MITLSSSRMAARSCRRHGEARLRRPEPRQPDDTAPSGRRSRTGWTRSPIGKRTVPSRAYVAAFNFKGADQQKRVGVLSGGERNRVHLAKMLKREHNVLLLDEPTNDLDIDTLRALEDALEEFAGCAVVISHDRWFLDRLATHILPSRATAMSSGSRATSRPMRPTSDAASAPRRTSRTGSSTGRSTR